MTSQLDIYRTAVSLIQQHGDDAAIFAAAKVDEQLANGNLESHTMWKAVLRVIDALQAMRPGPNAAIH